MIEASTDGAAGQKRGTRRFGRPRGSCRGPWSMRRLLFDAPRRTGSVRQSKKQVAGARTRHIQGRETSRPPKSASVSGLRLRCAPSATIAEASAKLIGTNMSGCSRACWSAERRAMFGYQEGAVERQVRTRAGGPSDARPRSYRQSTCGVRRVTATRVCSTRPSSSLVRLCC